MPRSSRRQSQTPTQHLQQPPDSHSASLAPSHGNSGSSGAASGDSHLVDVLNHQLDIDDVRRACTSLRMQAAYASYRRSISTWIRSTLCDPDRFFNIDGGINVHEFTPTHFRDFILAKINSAYSLKVTTLGGYRSAVNDIYRQQQLPLSSKYADDMKNIFAGLKRIEATRNQTGPGEAKKAGKTALPYSAYEQVCKKTLVLPDGGFAHVFLALEWNLVCRSQSVETIHSGHLSNEDDSVGIVFHKSKVNQDGNGPKDPRHIYSNPLAPWTCCITALGFYWACCPRQGPGPLFPGSLQRNRFRKAFARAIGQPDDQAEYGTHSIRKGAVTYACNGSTGGPSIVSVCLTCGWSLGGVQDRYFRYESAGDQF